MSDATHTAEQDKIWAYFQNEDPEQSFAAARPRLDALVRRIARLSSTPQPCVLNIGVGSGHFERVAAARGWEIHSLDPDGRSLERLANEGVVTHVGSAETIPVEDDRFDFVVASEVLEHLTDAVRRRTLGEIARVLRPGGRFLGTVPYREDLRLGIVVCPHCGDRFHRWGHQASFDVKRMRDELEADFAVKAIRSTAFVSFRDRGPGGKLKSLLRWALGRMGQGIAVPTLYWEAVPREGHAR